MAILIVCIGNYCIDGIEDIREGNMAKTPKLKSFYQHISDSSSQAHNTAIDLHGPIHCHKISLGVSVKLIYFAQPKPVFQLNYLY